MVLVLYLDNALLMQFKVVLTKGKNATKVGPSVHGDTLLLDGLIAQRICCVL
jgi:hypothetical protein